MTHYEYIRWLFEDAFSVGVWAGQVIAAGDRRTIQRHLTTDSKMLDLMEFLSDSGIEFENGQIVLKEQEG